MGRPIPKKGTAGRAPTKEWTFVQGFSNHEKGSSMVRFNVKKFLILVLAFFAVQGFLNAAGNAEETQSLNEVFIRVGGSHSPA
jgi:hypothetical protein